METQVKGARAMQKKSAKGQRKVSERGERKLSSGPTSESEHTRRLFVSAPNKRATARFAKGPSDTGGFTYPRRRVVSEVVCLDVKSALSDTVLENELHHLRVISVENFEPTRELENLCAVSSEPIQESSYSEPASESAELVFKTTDIESQLSLDECEPSNAEEYVQFDAVSPKVEVCDVSEKVEEIPVATTPTKIEVEEPDNTIGPGDCRPSESESSEEESEVDIVKPSPVIPIKPLKPKSASPAIVRKAVAPVLPVYRKVVSPSPAPSVCSSWSKFLPLVIEIKATFPYPMHLLGFILVLVTGLLLRLLYQFGADLGGELELQVQLVRLAKLAFLFVVVAMCVNFVEDNKELRHKDPASPAQPKLRPSKMTKNKKKMMMKEGIVVSRC
jgi:hypothetical protein